MALYKISFSLALTHNIYNLSSLFLHPSRTNTFLSFHFSRP
ncbi:hypothetical protein HMPREF9151_01831 [Hoylesella saccharolytica F0055]|uniref:Uncharacterized protein n=1 Tax=Hoylesella saccharolytica F0055 TaxID=1127699 RepID=L1N6V1_9BACT|nr:hypothetical protein HMPREF9151_01831 [Hoylesella saccharolytica F0055]